MPAPGRPKVTAETGNTAPHHNNDQTVPSPVRTFVATVVGTPAVAGEVGTLGPYRLVKELGRGGMGVVYAAVDTRLGRRVALKVLLPELAADDDARNRFLRESRAAAGVSHDNVVTVYEADARDGVPYIAMQFLDGCPLDRYLKAKGALTVQQAVRVATDAAAGLAAAHAVGLVHRDVKPGNLWLEAPRGRVKVLDFGLAKPADADVELTKSGAVVGTPAYMSPEQARGERVDFRTDLFSLGAVLYKLCTGRLPFQGPTTMAVLMALGTEDPPPVRGLNPEVPDVLAHLIHQLLAKRPDARPQSATEVVRRLRDIAAGAPAPAHPALVAVPLAPTAATNPFADLDADGADGADGATEMMTAADALPPRPRSRWLPAALGYVALLALTVGGVIVIVIKNKDGSETKIELPDGATVTVKKDGKTVAQIGPFDKTGLARAPAPREGAPTNDRQVAERILTKWRNGKVSDGTRYYPVPQNLPPDFELKVVEADGDIGSDDLALLKNCSALTVLNLGRATEVRDVAHLKGLPLSRLYLEGAGVSDLAPLKGAHLTEINIGYTGVTDLRPLAGMPLSSVCCWHTGVSDLGPLKGAPLTSVQLNATPVESLEPLKGAKLVYLTMVSTKVTDLSPLAGMPLETLSCTTNRIGDEQIGSLLKCRELKLLELAQTQITKDGFERLKNGLPKCKIVTSHGTHDPK